jgi:tetratricopeptide (TPR) repeat protein
MREYPTFVAPHAFATTIALARGYQLLNDQRYQEAAAEFQKVLDFAPSNFQAHQQIGFCFEQMKDTELAVTHYTRAIQLGSEDAMLHQLLAMLYSGRNRIAEAESVLQKGICLNPANPWLWKTLGELYLKMGQDDSGTECIKMVEAVKTKVYLGTLPKVNPGEPYPGIAIPNRNHPPIDLSSPKKKFAWFHPKEAAGQ